jgi:serine protease Do
LLGEEGNITVEFANGTRTPAQLLAHDKIFELALLKAETSNLATVAVARKMPPIGRPVIAAGFLSPPGPHSDSHAFAVASGVISSDRIEMPRSDIMPGYFLGTDMEIGFLMNLLFNNKGELLSVMGLLHRSEGDSPYYSPGTFYYPLSSLPPRLLADLREGKEPQHGRLGVSMKDPSTSVLSEPIRSIRHGAEVVQVSPNSPADGILKVGDLIFQFNDIHIRGPSDLRRMTMATYPGTSVRLLIRRQSKELPVEMTIGKWGK